MPGSFDKAYILHQRHYTDSRVILEFMTLRNGVVHAVARIPGKRDRAKYETFQSVNVEFIGASDLKTLRYCEQSVEHLAPSLTGTSLFCGLYVNELFQRLLPPAEPFPQLFSYYEVTLQRLRVGVTQQQLEAALRQMEFFLLAQLGFALDFSVCADSGAAIASECVYRYIATDGFSLATDAHATQRELLLPGSHLLAIANGDIDDVDVLKTAKAISRRALAPHLNGKPLKSRELFS